MKETVYRYSLHTEDGAWLGEVLLTDKKEFFASTDYGNFNYCFFTEEDIRQFMLRTNVNYLGRKMFQSVSYQCSTKAMRECCMNFAEQILPSLQEAIKSELAQEKGVER